MEKWEGMRWKWREKRGNNGEDKRGVESEFYPLERVEPQTCPHSGLGGVN